jgi:hypothetical protein
MMRHPLNAFNCFELCTFNFVHSVHLTLQSHPSCRRSISHALQSALATRLSLAAPSAPRQPYDQHGRPALRRHAFPRKSRRSLTSKSSSPRAPSVLPNKSLKRPSPKPRPRSLKSANRLKSTNRPPSRPTARAPNYTLMSVVVLPQSSRAMSTLRLAKSAVLRTTLCDGVTRATGVTMVV